MVDSGVLQKFSSSQHVERPSKTPISRMRSCGVFGAILDRINSQPGMLRLNQSWVKWAFDGDIKLSGLLSNGSFVGLYDKSIKLNTNGINKILGRIVSK